MKSFIFKIKNDNWDINLYAKFEGDLLLELYFTEEKDMLIPKEYSSFVTRINNYFLGNDDLKDVKVKLVGTPFQILAWEALMAIPYGKVISYKEQANLSGREKSHRAIANANGKNKISIIVP
ncbi:MAG: methylated-DNA--[protein]-cysteine S-methyltransferase [Lachnospirales bacterium]